MRNVYTVGIVCSGYLYTVYIIYRYISDYFIGSKGNESFLCCKKIRLYLTKMYGQATARLSLHIEAEVHYIAVLDNVVFAFDR